MIITQRIQAYQPVKIDDCSGDTDSVVPITATRYSLPKLQAPVKTPWYPWYIKEEVMQQQVTHSQYSCFSNFETKRRPASTKSPSI